MFNLSQSTRNLSAFLALTILLPLTTTADDKFPLRAKYSDIPLISTEELAAAYDSIAIIDVRSTFEFDVIHVGKAKHISISKGSFGKMLEKALGGDKTKKAAVYCNGYTCSKSYKAAKKAKELGFTNVVAFDAGIFEWTMAYPDKSTLLGVSPVDKSNIIPKAQFVAKQLEASEFESQIANDPKAFVIDARDPMQRKKSPKYKVKSRLMPMDKLVGQLDKAGFKKLTAGKKLYIYDAVGKQVRWLQYHIEKNGITDYYFLKGGVWSLYGEQGANK